MARHSLCETSRPAYVLERSAGASHAEGTLRQGKPIDRSFNLGTLCSLALVRREAVSLLPDGVSFAAGAIVGCGVMTGYGSVVNAAKVKPGTSVVVLGAGGVGLSAIQGARITGAAKIIAVERRSNRLEAAKKFGATHTIQATPEDKELLQAAAQVKALLGGRGADYCFESTAVPELGAAPLAFVAQRRDGGPDERHRETHQFRHAAVRMGQDLHQSALRPSARRPSIFPRIFDLYAKGELLLDELISRTYRLEELPQAFEDMLQGRNYKGVVLFPATNS